MVQLAEDSAVYMKAMVVQAEYNKEKDAYRELLSNDMVAELSVQYILSI